MRNLRILRQKAFAASMVAGKVYISDPVSGDTDINGILCRKIGTLKNGEEGCYPISEEACTVFVVGDKLSRNYCSAYYHIPAGNEDVSLSGKHKLDPTTGNPFCFDGAENQQPLPNQKPAATAKARLFFFGLVALGVIAGILIARLIMAPSEAAEITFSSNGMSITLTEDFEEIPNPDFTVCYGSPTTGVSILRERFVKYPMLRDLPIEEYTELFEEPVTLNHEDGLYWYEYEAEDEAEDETYRYFAYIYKTDNAYWEVHFGTIDSLADSMEDDFAAWAKTVTFD